MTLQEYFNQDEPQPNLKVILNETEYIRVKTIRDKGYIYSLIKIPAVEERYKQYNLTGMYIQINDRQGLYTVDEETGKPKKLSVFHLPEEEIEIPEIIRNYTNFNDENVRFLNEWRKNNPYKPNQENERNNHFKKDYNSFLRQAKEKYGLTDEDIDFWSIK